MTVGHGFHSPKGIKKCNRGLDYILGLYPKHSYLWVYLWPTRNKIKSGSESASFEVSAFHGEASLPVGSDSHKLSMNVTADAAEIQN